jgi:hypothetical protein
LPPLLIPNAVQRPPGRWGRRLLIAASIAALAALAVLSARTRGEPSEQVPVFPSPAPAGAPLVGGLEAERQAVPVAIVLRVSVVDRCWLRVTTDGRVVAEMTANEGFTRTFRAARRLDLRLGNAGAARLTLNGRRLRLVSDAGTIEDVSFVRDAGGLRVVRNAV